MEKWMSRYVLVDAISQFRMRYVVEVPDDVENPKDEGIYPLTPGEYAADSVTCEDTREFSQEHLGEMIIDTREVTFEEAIEQFRKDNNNYVWDEDTIVKNSFTEIGFNRQQFEAEEEKKWRSSMSL
jgi:hypothetical protein